MNLIGVRVAKVVVTVASQGSITAGSTSPVLGGSSHVGCWRRCVVHVPWVHKVASRLRRDHHRAGHAVGLLSNAAAAMWTACAAA